MNPPTTLTNHNPPATIGCGLNPNPIRREESDTPHNHRLKNAMFTAAFVATQHDPDARAYYQHKRSQGKRHNAAVICVARRRCNIILAMLKTQTPYQEPQPQNLPQAGKT